MKKILVTTNLLLVVALISVLAYTMKKKNHGEFKDTFIDIGMTVSNASNTRDFYSKVIGMKEITNFELNSEFATKIGETNGQSLHIHVLQLDEGNLATQLKIMEIAPPAIQVEKQYIHDSLGMQYLTFNVNNLKPFLARFEKYGVKTLGETPVGLSRGRQVVVVQDPDGNFIELIGHGR